MRLYSRTGATEITGTEHGDFTVDAQGGFTLPDDLSERLHRFHIGGEPMWETDLERHRRLMAEEIERRQDPATLLAAVQQLVIAGAAAAQTAPPPAAAAPRRGRPPKTA